MKRILHTILMLLVAGVIFAQSYPRKCTEEDIPSSERKKYIDECCHFIYYYYNGLLEIEGNEGKHSFMNAFYADRDKKSLIPEFTKDETTFDRINAGQYLMEMDKTFSGSEREELEFQVKDFVPGDFMMNSLNSCYIPVNYNLTLTKKDEIIFTRRCQMFILFKDIAKYKDAKLMQVEPTYFLFKKLKDDAINGDVESQFKLGMKYYLGEDFKQSYEKAVEWYTKAAEQGHEEAQYQLGKLYEKGEGVPQSYKKAFDWIFNAARNGYADAQYEIGQYHESVYWGSGRGSVFWNKVESLDDKPHHWVVKKRKDSYFLAKEYYRLAMEKGHSLAALELGFLYYLIEDSKEQYKECILKAFTDSNIKRISTATYELKMRASQRHYRKNKWIWEYVFMFAQKGANYGDVYCQGILGHCFLYARGCKKNYNEAFRLLKLAAEQGDYAAQIDLARCYYKGWGTEVNSKLGEYWYYKYRVRE